MTNVDQRANDLNLRINANTKHSHRLMQPPMHVLPNRELLQIL